MNSKIRKILKYLKDELIKTYKQDLASVILFGSQARDDFAMDSDIDVLILLNREAKAVEEIRKINILIADISLKFNQLISCVFMSRNRYENEKSPLVLNIKKEGVTL